MSQGLDSAVGMEEKFEKMINSEDRNKKLVIFKFVVIALLLIGFLFFYLLYGLGFLVTTSASVSNYYLAGRRPALIRFTQLLLCEYLLDPQYSPLSLRPIRTLNENIINEFYTLEANLLFIDFRSSTELFSSFNNGNVCGATNSFISYAKFK